MPHQLISDLKEGAAVHKQFFRVRSVEARTTSPANLFFRCSWATRPEP